MSKLMRILATLNVLLCLIFIVDVALPERQYQAQALSKSRGNYGISMLTVLINKDGVGHRVTLADMPTELIDRLEPGQQLEIWLSPVYAVRWRIKADSQEYRLGIGWGQILLLAALLVSVIAFRLDYSNWRLSNLNRLFSREGLAQIAQLYVHNQGRVFLHLISLASMALGLMLWYRMVSVHLLSRYAFF